MNAIRLLLAHHAGEPPAGSQNSPLVRSLQRPHHQPIRTLERRPDPTSRAGTYNAVITQAEADTILLFCDEQLDLGPQPLEQALTEGLRLFDVVGVIGNQRRQPGQLAWWLDGDGLERDEAYLSGQLLQGPLQAPRLQVLGPTPMPVELLDGVFIAARAGVLRDAGIRFDDRFNHNVMALDFCRQARKAGLGLGTIPLQLHHVGRRGQSLSVADLDSLAAYQHKWQDAMPAHHWPSLQRFLQARALETQQGWPAAERLYRSLLKTEDDSPVSIPAQLQLAFVLHQQGRDAEALTQLEQLLEHHPGHARAHANRGVLQQLAGDLQGAASSFSRALELRPALRSPADNLILLARQLQAVGRLQEGIDALRAVLRATPRRPDMLLDLGSALMVQGRVEAAERCFARLLHHHPDHPGAHFQMALAQEALGAMEQALALHQQALARDPGSADVLLAMELVRLHLCDWQDYDQRMTALEQSLLHLLERPDRPAPSPLRPLYFPLPRQLQQQLSQRWCDAQTGALLPLARQRPEPGPLPQGDRRLRIGYLSADFRNHAMGNLIHDLFAQHDRDRFEVFAYAIADLCDPYTRSIQAGVDHYHVVARDTNEQIADRIRADGIDVLIDLMGHTHHSRPGVLAMRPAPLQLHYLGFPGPLGCRFIDGVIADRWLIPDEHARKLQDTVHHLPWGFVSSPPPDGLPSPSAEGALDRRSLGLPADGIVYACFNRPEKIDPGSFQAWMTILRHVPDAVLLLVVEVPSAQERLRKRALENGVDPARVIFTSKVASEDFPQLCKLADLLLDTAIYGSGATGVAALAAGLPLLTTPGESFASRMGASLCAATELEPLICTDRRAYIDQAINLGSDRARLQALRQHLLEHQHRLPLFDTAGWVRHLEALLLRLKPSG